MTGQGVLKGPAPPLASTPAGPTAFDRLVSFSPILRGRVYESGRQKLLVTID
jgi:hypothetical protein